MFSLFGLGRNHYFECYDFFTDLNPLVKNIAQTETLYPAGLRCRDPLEICVLSPCFQRLIGFFNLFFGTQAFRSLLSLNLTIFVTPFEIKNSHNLLNLLIFLLYLPSGSIFAKQLHKRGQ